MNPDDFRDPGMETFMQRVAVGRETLVAAARAQSPSLPGAVESRVTATPSTPIPQKSSQAVPVRGLADVSTPRTPFFVVVSGDPSDRDYEVVSNGGIVRDKWTGSTVTVTGIDSGGSLGTDTYLWINFSVSDGVVTGGVIQTGSAFPGEVIATGADLTFVQTELNALVMQISDDIPIQILNSNLRVFSSNIGTAIAALALPST